MQEVTNVERAIPTESEIISQTEAMGFVERYADYADVIEAPRMMHEIVAMQIVASVLNRNGVLIPHGSSKYPLDLWVLLLSGSGHGRSTLTNMAKGVVRAAGLPDLIRNSEWGSLPAFYQDLAEHPTGLFVWGELSQKLKLMGDGRFAGMKEWLTDRYDNLDLPEERRYRITGRGTDTAPIIFTRSPRTNILATSSEDWFFHNVEFSDSAGGFLPRWLMVRSHGETRNVPTPLPLDEMKGAELAKVLERINGLRGEADLSTVLPHYEEWYGYAKQRFASHPNGEVANAYFNRHRVHILKLAVIYEAAMGASLSVAEKSWWDAVKFASDLEATIFDLLDTGMNALGFKQKKAEERIRSAGASGLTLSEFTRAFQHDPARDRDAWLQTLKDTGTVKDVPAPTGGRTAHVLVHRDFFAYAAGRNPVEGMPRAA